MKKVIVIFNKFLFTLIFSCLFSITVTAAEQGTFTIKHVGYSANSNHILIVVNEAIESTSCQNQRGFRVTQQYKEAHGELLSLFTTAKITGNRVIIGYNETDCAAGSSTVNYMYLL